VCEYCTEVCQLAVQCWYKPHALQRVSGAFVVGEMLSCYQQIGDSGYIHVIYCARTAVAAVHSSRSFCCWCTEVVQTLLKIKHSLQRCVML
jgi:hypothetical protein